MMYRILHWITGCYGHSDREVDTDGIEWIGFRCAVCNKFTSLSPSIVQSTRGWAALEKRGHPDAAYKCEELR